MTLQEMIDQIPPADEIAGRLGLRSRSVAAEASTAFGLPAAFALGAVAGVAAALLAAPRPGEQLRRDLQRGAQETIRSLRERLAAMMPTSETADRARRTVEGVE